MMSSKADADSGHALSQLKQWRIFGLMRHIYHGTSAWLEWLPTGQPAQTLCFPYAKA